MNQKPIKVCHHCHRSLTLREFTDAIVGEEVGEHQDPPVDGMVAVATCYCGQTLRLSWSIIRQENEKPQLLPEEDSTEVYMLDAGTMLLCWPMPDGSYVARKVSMQKLMGGGAACVESTAATTAEES